MIRVLGVYLFIVATLQFALSGYALAQDEESVPVDITDGEETDALPPDTAPATEDVAPVEPDEPVAEAEMQPMPPPPDEPRVSSPVPRERLFGTYRINLGIARPDLSDSPKFEDFYGTPSLYPTFGVEVFAFDWYLTLGARFNVGFFVEKGHASLSAPDQPYVKDPNGKLELTMIPVQAALAFETTVFRRKWLVLSGWFGYERTYFQETRIVPASATALNLAEAADASQTKSYVNSGWKAGTVSGLALSISLDPLRDGSVNTMEDVMGLRTIYLTPFVEIAKYDSGLGFGRKVIGAAFTFETVH